MRARIRATGEILEILDIGVSGKYFYLSNDKKYSRNELEFLSETIDWQQVRIQAAIAAMDIVKGAYNIYDDVEQLVQHSVRIADALVEELKGGQDDNNHQ